MVLQESQTDELERRAATLEKATTSDQDVFLGDWARVCVRAVPKHTTAAHRPMLSHRAVEDAYVNISTFSE
jgi:hypothetical protein